MGLSAAERMRKYRLEMKEDPERYAEYLRKESKRYAKRKEKGEITTINKCSDREKNAKRRKWRIEKRERRKKKKEEEARLLRNSTFQITPPQSPEDDVQQRRRGRPNVRISQTKAKKEIRRLKEEVKKRSREAEKYRKRYERLQKKTSTKTSPQKHLRIQLRGQKIHKDVRKELLFNSIVVQSIRNKMESLVTEKDKQIVSKSISNELLKKYNLSHLAHRLWISPKRLRSNAKRDMNMSYDRKKHSNRIGVRLSLKIRGFYEEDINSRTMPGKKDFISRKGLKKQKRILNESLKTLHQKFLNGNPDMPVSYSTFCKLRPFWVVQPKCADRDTCGCRLHINASYMIDRLVENKVLPTCSFTDVCQHVVCDTGSKLCMYRECNTCNGKKIHLPEGVDPGKQVWVYSWQNKLEERELNKSSTEKSTIRVRVSVKEKIQYTLFQLAEELSDFLNTKFCRHTFNISHQFEQMKTLKQNLSADSCVIHIDFSENYSCKYSTEPQSVHFGASRKQVSLHTGVVYQYDTDPVSFCSMSENTRHDPSAIWAHLHPVIHSIKQSNPNVKTVHFLSDGPTTQYRSKKQFFLMKEKMHRLYGFHTVTWNFSESGHGKGAPDGIGGVVKRQADKLVAQGQDIVDVNELYTCLGALDLKVNLYKISSTDINQIDSELPSDIALVPGTLSIHQVVSHHNEPHILTRVLSCFCTQNIDCQCFGPKRTILNESKSVNDLSRPSRGTNASSLSNENSLIPITLESLDEHLIGKWVVVLYDEVPYPGQIQDTDTGEMEVTVLHCIGENRYFWPCTADILWYKVPEFVVGLIPELQPVTQRHLQIIPSVWHEIKMQLNLD